VIERAKKKRGEIIVAPLRRFAARLKSSFRASVHPATSVPFDAWVARRIGHVKGATISRNGFCFFTTKENTMDGHSTKVMNIHRSDAESPAFRQPALLWVVIALLGLAIIICLLPSSLFVSTALDLAFPYPWYATENNCRSHVGYREAKRTGAP
jgi:hypothetical protein